MTQDQPRLEALAAYDMIDADTADQTVVDLTALCELAATRFGVSGAAVDLLDDGSQHRIAAVGTAGASGTPAGALSDSTLTGGADVFVSDASADPRFAGLPEVDGRRGQARLYCAVLLCDPDGRPVGTLSVFDDQPYDVPREHVRALQLLAGQVMNVLELRRCSALLARDQAELARAQERLVSFAGQLSHDLKAPITAVLGFAELLAELDTVSADETARGYVARCVSASRRMQATIDELLAFARISSAHAVRPVPLDDIIPAALAELGEPARSAQVSWSGPELVGDPGQLRALVKHLLANAINYRGEAPCVVSVTSERIDGDVVLRVSDNGPGIPPESRGRVVLPLVRLRTDVPGAGLGLAVCARIADAHGGSLRVEETPGGGTTVTVVLRADEPR
jgi:signal transduction histidine kinase